VNRYPAGRFRICNHFGGKIIDVCWDNDLAKKHFCRVFWPSAGRPRFISSANVNRWIIEFLVWSRNLNKNDRGVQTARKLALDKELGLV
jgi:hypothetical protein